MKMVLDRRDMLCSLTAWIGAGATLIPTFAQADTPDEFDARWRSAVADLRASGLSVVVGVKHRESPLLIEAFGGARQDAIPAGRTQIDINSVTKTVTAVAILKLVQQGKLRVSDSLSALFPGVPADKASITIHQLLTHSAGFTESVGPDEERLTRDAFLDRAFASKLRTRPGQRYHYSNSGFSVLAAVIELRSGMSYEQFLRNEVLKNIPAPDTGYMSIYDDRRSLRTADGQTIKQASWGGHEPYWNLIGNGGLVSSVEDFIRFRSAVAEGRIIPADLVALGQRAHVREGPSAPSHYGYGLVVQNIPRIGETYWHDGGNDVFSAIWFHFAVPNDLIFIGGADTKAGGATTASKILVKHLYGLGR